MNPSQSSGEMTVSACQNCGLPFGVRINCPDDRDGIHIQGGTVKVVPCDEAAVERARLAMQDEGARTGVVDFRRFAEIALRAAGGIADGR